MGTVAWAFRLRWLLWAAGAVLLVLGARSFLEKRPFPGIARLESFAERNFGRCLSAICAGFFLLTLLAKYSQLRALVLHAEDFWLFEDMLEQMRHGGFFLTRFAPQALGWVQHGAVHAMFTLILALPLVWAFSATFAALAWGPITLALAGGVLGSLARRRFAALGGLVLALAFLCSSQVGKILMYDMHPEAAYPLFVLLWVWAMGFGEEGRPRIRWSWLIFAVIAGIGIKEDSFLAFFPWFIWALAHCERDQRKAAALSLALGILVYGVQLLAVKNWTSGSWGPSTWFGSPVLIPGGAESIGGVHWDSPSAAWIVLKNLTESRGGVGGVLVQEFHFLVSRPWLSLLAFAPWLALRLGFWIVLLPLCAAYSLLPMAAPLWLYYSAIFLGSIWAGMIVFSPRSPRDRPKYLWVLTAALLLGDGGIQIYSPSDAVREMRAEVARYLHCLEQVKGSGVVAPPFLGMVPHERVWTDRAPRSLEQWARTDFVLFAPNLPTYEMPEPALGSLEKILLHDPLWERWNSECQIEKSADRRRAELFVRRY